MMHRAGWIEPLMVYGGVLAWLLATDTWGLRTRLAGELDRVLADAREWAQYRAAVQRTLDAIHALPETPAVGPPQPRGGDDRPDGGC